MSGPTPSRYWIKLDALLTRNPKVARLSDGAFRAFITSLCEAKLCQSEGEWPSRDHYLFAVGPKAGRHLDALLGAGLLEVDDDGWIRVHDWSEWQPKDATSAERSKRYRDRLRAASRDERGVTRDAPWRDTEESRGDLRDLGDLGDSPRVTNGVAPADPERAGAPPIPPPVPCDTCGGDLLGTLWKPRKVAGGRMASVHVDCPDPSP